MRIGSQEFTKGGGPRRAKDPIKSLEARLRYQRNKHKMREGKRKYDRSPKGREHMRNLHRYNEIYKSNKEESLLDLCSLIESDETDWVQDALGKLLDVAVTTEFKFFVPQIVETEKDRYIHIQFVDSLDTLDLKSEEDVEKFLDDLQYVRVVESYEKRVDDILHFNEALTRDLTTYDIYNHLVLALSNSNLLDDLVAINVAEETDTFVIYLTRDLDESALEDLVNRITEIVPKCKVVSDSSSEYLIVVCSLTSIPTKVPSRPYGMMTLDRQSDEAPRNSKLNSPRDASINTKIFDPMKGRIAMY